jgi:transposase, IS6 family
VQHDAPELKKRCCPHLKATNDSWRVDETYVKVKKVWMYLYRAVDSQGHTLEFLLSPKRDTEAAKRFFSKTLDAPHSSTHQYHIAAPIASSRLIRTQPIRKLGSELKAEGIMPDSSELRQSSILSTSSSKITARIKRLVKLGMGFFSSETAWRTDAADMKR